MLSNINTVCEYLDRRTDKAISNSLLAGSLDYIDQRYPCEARLRFIDHLYAISASIQYIFRYLLMETNENKSNLEVIDEVNRLRN